MNRADAVELVCIVQDKNPVAVAARGYAQDHMAFVKGIFDNQADIAAAHDKGKELSIETAVSGIDIDFHPGAVKYFTEQGAM